MYIVLTEPWPEGLVIESGPTHVLVRKRQGKLEVLCAVTVPSMLPPELYRFRCEETVSDLSFVAFCLQSAVPAYRYWLRRDLRLQREEQIRLARLPKPVLLRTPFFRSDFGRMDIGLNPGWGRD